MKTKSTREKRTTIYDIAKAAGTSTATVSRVLSNSEYPISDEMRNRVLNSAKQLHYSPNLVGRTLKKKQSHDIGVIIPNISNPFYSQLILGIEKEARDRGFNILLCNSYRNAEYENNAIELMYQKQVDGILLSTICDEHRLLRNLTEIGLKVVCLDQNVDDLECNRVGFDFSEGSILAIDYLFSLGHREIGFATTPLKRKSRTEIFNGYKQGLIKNSIPYNEEYLFISEIEKETGEGTFEFEIGIDLARKCAELKRMPTAILAVNDITAMGLIQGFNLLGINVPNDISIVGFDNIEFSSMCNPPLTTIDQPSFNTGRIACKILIDDIENKSNDVVAIKLEPRLIKRSSTVRMVN